MTLRLLGLDTSSSRTGPGCEFRFSRGMAAAWRPSDTMASDMIFSRSIANWMLRIPRRIAHTRRSEPTGVFLGDLNSTRGIVVLPRDNTQVVVARSITSVCKISRGNSDTTASFESEVGATKLVPEHTAAVMAKSGPGEHPSYLVSRYVEDRFPATVREWPESFGKCLEIVTKCAMRQKPTLQSLGTLMEEWMHGGPADDSASEFDLRSHKLLQRVSNHLEPYNETLIGLGFAHGDLTRPNFRRPAQNEVRLIDWGNGGIRPLLFDLAVHEFYRNQAAFWSKLHGASSVESFSDAGHGHMLSHARRMFEIAGLEFDLKLLQVHILASLYVLIASNRRRYLGQDEYEGGRFFQELNRTVDMVFEVA